MASDLPEHDPVDQDPRERGLRRRSGAPGLSPWLILGVIGLLAVGAYVVSAVL